MKLVVGLGNPGDEYKNTRHNAGFMMLDNYLGNVSWKDKFKGLYYETNIKGEKVIFLKPCMYMNLSGEVVRKYIDFFKINIEDILVISDDLDLPIGVYRLKQTGSSGGHNGLKNIEACIGTKDYKRLKIGISKDSNIDTKDYVLGKLDKDGKEKLEEVSKVVNNVLDDYFQLDFNSLMNKYNHK